MQKYAKNKCLTYKFFYSSFGTIVMTGNYQSLYQVVRQYNLFTAVASSRIETQSIIVLSMKIGQTCCCNMRLQSMGVSSPMICWKNQIFRDKLNPKSKLKLCSERKVGLFRVK